MEKETSKCPLRLVSVDRVELMIGAFLILYSFMIPWIMNVETFAVYDVLLRAMRVPEPFGVVDAAVRLVLLNTLRSIPHYVGAFFVGESISFRWRGAHRAWHMNAVLILIILLTTYRGIEAIHGIRYDFGLPAILVSLFVFFFRKVHYSYISMWKKALMIVLILTAFQFLDIMPALNGSPAGRGETSMDVKMAAWILGIESGLNTVGTVGVVLFLTFAVALFLQLRDENTLKQLATLREENHLITIQAQLNEMKNRTYQEIQYLVHDLKTPLTTVQSLVDVLKMRSEAEARTKDIEYLDHIENAVDRMSHMISEILYEDQRTPITTQELMNVAMGQYAVTDYASYLRVENQVPEAILLANRFLFPRALVDLLQNSAQAIPRGREPDIWLRIFRGVQDKTIVFAVEDNGVGIDQEKLGRIWEHGYSGKKSSGLGLAFVRKVVESMEGVIIVDSKPGSGTKIYLEFPEA